MEHSASTVTVHGLHHWYKRAFEKLGWMVVAKPEKRAYYLARLKELRATLEAKAEGLLDADRKADLQIMIANVTKLHAAAEALLNHLGSLESMGGGGGRRPRRGGARGVRT